MNYGELKLTQIDSDDFWRLIDELCDDHSVFLHNKKTILEAYKEGNLYGLRIDETEEMYERGARMDEVFCKDSFYLLPCFCVKEKDTAILLWTHRRARNRGFAKKMVELLDLQVASHPLPD